MDVLSRTVVMLLCMLLASLASAEDGDAYLFANLPPRLPAVLQCGTNEFPPFTYLDAQGHAAGLEVDIVREVARRLKLEVDIRILPWPRLLAGMKSGSLDCMFAAFITDKRSTYMNFTHVPLHVSRLSVYVRRGHEFPFSGLQDLRGKKLGIIRDFRTIDALDALLEKGDFATRVYGNDFEQLFDMLAAGRVDMVIVNNQVANTLLAKQHNGNIVELPYALSSNSAFLAFTRQRNFDNLIPKIDYALFGIIADGTYARIFSQYSSQQ